MVRDREKRAGHGRAFGSTVKAMTRRRFRVATVAFCLLFELASSSTLESGSVTKSSTSVVVPQGQNFAVRVPSTILSGNTFSLTVTLAPIQCKDTCLSWPERVSFKVSTQEDGGDRGKSTVFHGAFLNATSPGSGFGNGLSFTVSDLATDALGAQVVSVQVVGPTESATVSTKTFSIPPFLSVLPPAITLVLAVWSKQVVPSLLVGIWCGAFFANQYNPITSFCSTFSVYFSNAVSQGGHAPVVLFALVLGGVLELVDKSGGAKGLARVARGFASTRMRALMCAWAMSMFIFFDDYSCILIVGSTLKSSLKEVRVSSAKLAFIIHIVGVNLPSICPISSWVGVELGYIKDQYSELGLSDGPFSVFLRTLPYRFFPVLAILVPLISIATSRDFGPLLTAEKEFLEELESTGASSDAETGNLDDASGDSMIELNGNVKKDGDDAIPVDTNAPAPSEWWGNAVIPFSVIIVTTFAGIFASGMAASPKNALLIDIVANSQSVNALLWSAAAASLVCIVMFSIQRLMSLETMVAAWTTGFKDMMEPILILLLAWALGGVIVDLQTSVYLSSALKGNLPACWLPALGTILACIVSFASGSAMGTMGILFPLVLPLAEALSKGDESIVMESAAAVLAGSTFGNTCSPIADNTVLASLATGCDLVLHAKTMVPYTLLTLFVSFCFGTLPVSLGLYGPGVGLLVCIGVVILVLRFFGTDPSARHRVPESDDGRGHYSSI